MLIGIQLSDLSRRSRWLLLLACAVFVAGLALWAFAPEPAVRLIRVWLAAVVALGLYWVSFLMDFRGRLRGGQLLIASLFALLPWILVVVLLLGFPQILLAGSA